jgi:hypothetical protein
MAPHKRTGRTLLLAGAVFCVMQGFPALSGRDSAPGLAQVPAEAGESNALAKVIAAAAQGMTAATVAAILSAVCEPVVNRLLVKRMTVSQAWSEITFQLVSNFFLTTFPTNMLKFPVFEIINMLLSFTSLSGSLRGIVNGFLFCSIMLPVTNYRFRKSMGWEIKVADLYQAYIPTVARDIVYGWARGVCGPMVSSAVAPETFFMKAACFGITVWLACIISSPGNEWRGYTLQPADRKLPFGEYFKPVNYARSTGIGAAIMGVALCVGMLVTPYAEAAFAVAKENSTVSLLVLAAAVVAVVVKGKK